MSLCYFPSNQLFTVGNKDCFVGGCSGGCLGSLSRSGQKELATLSQFSGVLVVDRKSILLSRESVIENKELSGAAEQS